MPRRNSENYSEKQFQKDLDELSRLIDDQNGGRRRRRDNRNDDSEEEQDGGRRRRRNDSEEEQDGGRRRRRNDNDDSDDEDQNGGGKHEKEHRTFTLIEVDGKDVKPRGVYRIKSSESPLKAAERAYSKLFQKEKGKKMSHEFKIRETSRYAGDKKVYGPYAGKTKKLDKPKMIKRGSSTIKIEWEHHVELK
jgi:hypothetical protein